MLSLHLLYNVRSLRILDGPAEGISTCHVLLVVRPRPVQAQIASLWESSLLECIDLAMYELYKLAK